MWRFICDLEWLFCVRVAVSFCNLATSGYIKRLESCTFSFRDVTWFGRWADSHWVDFIQSSLGTFCYFLDDLLFLVHDVSNFVAYPLYAGTWGQGLNWGRILTQSKRTDYILLYFVEKKHNFLWHNFERFLAYKCDSNRRPRGGTDNGYFARHAVSTDQKPLCCSAFLTLIPF